MRIGVVWMTAVCLFSAFSAKAQYVQGTIYDISRQYTIPYVSVLSASGKVAMTDSAGFYRIPVAPGDSIWFSYLGKETPRYAVTTIANIAAFDIAIQKAAVDLPGITLRKRNYRMDSLQNREDYAHLFNYKRPGFSTSTLSNGGFGVGLNLTELINSLNFRKNRSMAITQRWMIREEQDKYVNFRFSKELIQKLTHLYDEEELAVFMEYYRPDYELIAQWNDAELGMFILECMADFKSKNRFRTRR